MELTAAPVAQKERIIILDSLRGIAILGILLMNIAGMGLPFYSDPTVLDEKGINHGPVIFYLTTHVMAC